MAGVYGGSFLKPGSPEAKKFTTRLSTIVNNASRELEDIVTKYPNLDGKLFVSYPNVLVAVGRYFNDVQRLKTLHKIKKINRPKIAAYSIKWLAIYPALVSPIEVSMYASLTGEEKRILLNANILLIFRLITYFTGLESNPNLTDAQKNDLLIHAHYLLSTDQYCERSFSLLFQVIDLDPKRADIINLLAEAKASRS